ncbi:RNA polymerase I-specific transcription initiation factor RRN3-like protein [Drosera capensis]
MGMELPNQTSEYYAVEDTEVRDLELVAVVKHALLSVVEGDTDGYEQLLSTMHIPDRKGNRKEERANAIAALVTSLSALSGATYYINAKQHGRLLAAIISLSMWEFDSDVMDVLVEFIVSLATSSGRYVDLSLEMLVSNFTPDESYPLIRLSEPWGVEKKEKVLSRVHGALKDISDLIPLVPSRLFKIITERMPVVFAKEAQDLFDIERRHQDFMPYTSYAYPDHIVGYVTLCGERAQIRSEPNRRTLRLRSAHSGGGGSADRARCDDPTKGIFEMELEDEEAEAELPLNSSTRKGLCGNFVVDKLDSLMVLTFEHVKFCENSERWVKVFYSVLHSFEKTVLPAYKSKFTQFLMFYACSLDPEGCGLMFADWLADKFYNSNNNLTRYSNNNLTRMISIGYLASYLARAIFLSTSVVTCILERLVQWCSDYCKTQRGNMGLDGEEWLYAKCQDHSSFYAGCQAVLYILCFRMRSIMDIPHLKSQLLSMPFQQILKNPLQPLQVCLPSIVQEFVRQANAAQLLDESASVVFDGVLESEFSKAYGGQERLDMFFPFDPCLLKKCDSYIRPNYVYWSAVHKTYDVDEDDVDDDARSADDVFEIQQPASGEELLEGGNPETFDDYDEFNSSLRNMSITPKDSFLWMAGGEMTKFARPMPARLRPSMSP